MDDPGVVFEVNRSDFRQARTAPRPAAELTDGQLRLAVERFALTANNISYALAGDMLGYWGFFPAEAGWGRLPAMGLGRVLESSHPSVSEGGRWFGFYPMADEVVVSVEPWGEGFRDVGAHRTDHAPIYVSFLDVARDPMFRADRVDEFLLLRGLFLTSYLVDDFLADNGDHGAEQVLVTSASSKTSIALAQRLAARDRRAVGITSARNVEFVEGLGLYGTVVTYDDVESLDAGVRSVVVDMAGNGPVLARIHEHFAGTLGYSCRVGATHWEASGGRADLPGPTPEFFFAPGQAEKRNAEWGPGELDRRIGSAFTAFVDDAPRWLSVQHGTGPGAIRAAYLELLNGDASPEVGHILSMRPGELPA